MDVEQRDRWDRAYRDEREWADQSVPSLLAREVATRLAASARVLELGCGNGRDSAFFARPGHRVSALDFSEVAIARNRARLVGQDRLTWLVADLAQPLPFVEGRFDLVYARLSLHYFPDATTRRLVAEIGRVLRPGGLLGFLCKSERDPLYGQGDLVEPDMFVFRGHLRHFFREDYARDCLASDFVAESIESVADDPDQPGSAFVKAIARKAR